MNYIYILLRVLCLPMIGRYFILSYGLINSWCTWHLLIYYYEALLIKGITSRLKMLQLDRNSRNNLKPQVRSFISSKQKIMMNVSIKILLPLVFCFLCVSGLISSRAACMIWTCNINVFVPEKEQRQVQELFGQAADNCLNLKKPYWSGG